MREWVEYALAWCLLKILGLLPRPVARWLAAGVLAFLFLFRPRLKRVADINLRIAFPGWPEALRRRTFREMVHHLGWMAAEFARFPRYSRKEIARVVILQGFENFAAAERRGRGVLVLTGHTSAWELMPLAFSFYHHPIHFLARHVKNRKVDRLVNRYRGISGNQPIEKNQAARAILQVLRHGGTIGVLADQNTSPEEGVFVDFFGLAASTTSGLARLAQRTGAPVVPGYMYWDQELRKYRLAFEPVVELQDTGDEEADVRENTARFALVLESYIRAHPSEWAWVHKRWKNRPQGTPPIYDP